VGQVGGRDHFLIWTWCCLTFQSLLPYRWLANFQMDADGCDTERPSFCPPAPSFLCPPFMWPFFAPFALTQGLPSLGEMQGMEGTADWCRPQEATGRVVTLGSGERPVGTLSPAQRREKIMRFLAKRERRNFAKKISYHCRKRVADGRLRIKGRFITSAQAAALVQVPSHM